MKNIIITGTSRGIGFELARLFANQGHQVLALSRDTSPISELKLPNCHSISFDITSNDDISKACEYVSSNWDQVDILINNAGYLVKKPFLKLTNEDFLRSYQVNLFGTAALTRSILPSMNKGGHVVNISSMGGIQGSTKFPGLSAYSSSKGALITLTEVLAEEYKFKGPSFNVLCLGAVQTEMLQEAFPGFKAPLTALEMATYIMEFALTANKFYNGKVLPVSGTTP